MNATPRLDPLQAERLRDAMHALNMAAYSAAKAARIISPQSQLAADLKAMATATDKMVDALI